MGDDDVKYLPAGAVDKQTKVQAALHFQQGPFDKSDGHREIRARNGENVEFYMQISSSAESEYVTEGIDNYSALRELTESDLEDGSWIEASDYDSADEVVSPAYDEMDELSAKYGERLENAATEEEEREVLEEIWDEAAEMELDGRESFG